MQGQFARFHSAPAQPLQNCRGKMQARCGRGHRPRAPCKQGLIICLVRRFIRAINIRRQRHVTNFRDRLVQVAFTLKAELPQAQFAPAGHLRFQLPGREYNPLAHADLSPGPHQCLPCSFARLARQQHFNCGAQMLFLRARGLARNECFEPFAPPKQPRRNHLRIVHHQQFIAAQQFREIAEPSILPALCLPLQQQHSRSIARRRWMLRNPVRWQLVVEIRELHLAPVATLVELCYLMSRLPALLIRASNRCRGMPKPQVTISARGLRRVQSGHPWIYRSDVLSATAAAGDIVRVLNHQGRFAGSAFYSDQSQITLRVLTREDVPINRAFLLGRIRSAAARRETWVTDTEVFRLCYSEADLLPSLIVDRYADVLAIQTLSQATDRLKDDIVNILGELFSPKGILERNDPRVRLHEGLPQSVSVLHGEVPPTLVARMNHLQFEFDLFHGQKTGAFLDQRENHLAAAAYAHGEALDCFTYNGAFALTMASRCSHLEAIDLSPQALQQARTNAALNGISNVAFQEANCFDALRALEAAGRRFDTIVLDPPAFAKDRRSVDAALRGYKEINLRALKLLRPGGYLLTCSCSHHISEPEFLQMLAEASLDAGKQFALVERRTQSRDHPVLLTVPETVYIKAFIINGLK